MVHRLEVARTRRAAGSRRRRAAGAACLAAAAAAVVGCSDAPTGGTQHAWLQLGPDGERSARVITTDDRCPTIEIDGRSFSMDVRAAPDPPEFPVLTCEAKLPADATQATIGDARLPLPRPAVQRIAVIGDTGCRIEEGHVAQSCNDPHAWPFAGLAHALAELVSWLTGEPESGDFASLARGVASLDPDLIVHVGDFLYREGPCPEDDEGCAGSPYGYNWATIEADFFSPSEPLFRVAPLVFTRGNHESCNRAGPVWFRFLDPRPYDGNCVNHTEPYAVEVGGLQFLMFDSSDASDTKIDPAEVERYRREFDSVRRLAGPRSFFVTHRPVWAFGHAGEQDGQEVLFRDNPTLQAASENQLPAGVGAVLSGHIHISEVLSFDAPRAPQIVVGNSGTELDPAVTTPLPGLEIAGAVVATGETRDAFGFATLEAEGAAWRLTLRDLSGAAQTECTIEALQLRCH